MVGFLIAGHIVNHNEVYSFFPLGRSQVNSSSRFIDVTVSASNYGVDYSCLQLGRRET